MHIAVNTAMSPPAAFPSASSWGTRLMAAPAAPRAVTGTARPSGEEKPNSGVRIKLSLSASLGRSSMPS